MSVKGERSSGEEMVKAPTIIVDTGDVHKDLKIKLPDTYGRERSKLRHFWLHVELFLGFNSKKFISEQEKGLSLCSKDLRLVGSRDFYKTISPTCTWRTEEAYPFHGRYNKRPQLKAKTRIYAIFRDLSPSLLFI